MSKNPWPDTPKATTVIEVHAMQITLKARIVQEIDGEVVLAIDTRNLSLDEEKFLTALFPHCQLEVEKLLTREVLLSSIVST